MVQLLLTLWLIICAGGYFYGIIMFPFNGAHVIWAFNVILAALVLERYRRNK